MQNIRQPMLSWYEARLAPGLCGLGLAMAFLVMAAAV
jgi:hypothetical protein